jgi:choline-sulfatase
MPHPRPNLLYIHTDQHSPHVTGCYGDPLVETPNLDQLAAGGALFENAYCCSPICVPSRMSMLSGRHPYQNDCWTNEHILDSGIPTIAHAMGAAGYRPALAGRMHSLGPDQLRGYAERFVGDHSANHLGSKGPDRGVLEGTAGPQRVSLDKSGSGQMGYQVHDEDVTAAAVDFLNRQGVQKRAGLMDQPFSLTVGLMMPHPPYVARAEDFNRYAEILRSRAAYWGLVHRVDCLVGEILAALHANGFGENTLIVYTSDHGDMQGEHGLWWKHVFYEESVRVPLIVNWPGVVPAGQRSQRVVSALDVAATLLDGIGAPALPNSPGRSLLPLIDGRTDPPSWEDVAFSEYCTDQFGPPDGAYQRMIRRDDWKLVYYHWQPPQLFNLSEDPGELNNRADDPGCAAVLADLTAEVLDGWDPEKIVARIAQKKKDVPILRDWSRNTQPEERYRWDLRTEMNWLD